jgi:hypothetical protein
MAAKEFGVPMAEGGGSYSPVHVGTTTASPNRITLHLGVIDLPYVDRGASKGKKGKKTAATKTTGEVAEILEEKYGVLDTFAFARLPDIAKALEDSIAGQLETMMMGGHPSGNPLSGAESSITMMMKNFISMQEIEHMGIEGVPTQAAMNGVNHRLKHPYAKGNPRRPSFIDTSLYWSTLTAWFD